MKVFFQKRVCFFYLLLWSLLPSCQLDKNWSKIHQSKIGTKKKPELQKTTPIHIPLHFSWNEREDVYKVFNQLDCENCPDSFGHLVKKSFLTNKDVSSVFETGHCQGSLIGENLFLTARHCLPEELENPGDSCKDKIEIVFPRVRGKPAEVLECGELVDLSKNFGEDYYQPDWAILKLEQTSSRFAPEKSEESEEEQGLSDNQELFGFIPLQNSKTGEIKITRFQCQTIQKSIHFPEYSENKTAMAFLICDRPLTHGFSGTTLFRKKENQGYVPEAVLSHIIEIKKPKGQSLLNLKFSDKIIASQISCINNQSESCQFGIDMGEREKPLKRLIQKTLNQSKAEIDNEIDQWIKNQNHPILWKTVSRENWNQLPPSYLEYFKTNRQNVKTAGGGYDLQQNLNPIDYLQNLVPIYPECVQPQFIKQQDLDLQDGEIPVEIPMVKFSMNRVGEFDKISTHHTIFRLKASLALSTGFSLEEKKEEDTQESERKTFVIRFLSPVPSLQWTDRSIFTGAFKHGLAVIPICPGEEES